MNKLIKFANDLYLKDIFGYVMIFAAGVLWGTIGLFVNLLNGVGANTSLTSFIRLFMGFLILIPIMVYKGGMEYFRINKKGLIQCFWLGILTQALFNYCYNIAIKSVGVAMASILIYTAPVFVLIMSKIFFKEKIGAIKIIALILNILGCFLMVTGGNLLNLKLSTVGIIFGLLAAFFYSLVTIIGKVTSGNINPFTVIFYSFFFGWLALGIITAPWKLIVHVSSTKFWIYSIGFGLIPTVGSYVLYMGGINRKIEISRAPVIASIETVVATLIGVIIFKEKISLINVLGICCLLASILIMNLNFNVKDKYLTSKNDL